VLTVSFLPIVLLHTALVAVFGILLPYRRGIGFLDPVMVSAYACMGLIFSAPAAVDAFAKSRPQSMKEAFRRIGLAAAYGEGLALLMLMLGTVTINFSRRGRLRLPELDTLAESGLLGIAATAAMALLAGWMTLRFSDRTARLGTRAVLFFLLLEFWLHSARLPEAGLAGAALSAVIAGVLVYLLYREVNPR
jgi:hypothetical protein